MKIPLVVYVISLLVILAASVYHYKNIDTLDDFHMEIKKGSHEDPYLSDLKISFSQYLEKKNLQLENLSDEEIKKLITNNENEIIRKNRITGEPIIFEDSPGNFMIEKNENGERILLFYDISGNTLKFDI